ncbi:PAAR motif family protein [Pseudomonas aeruginosa]|uniref:PAAR domain-containing protein n=1 Tax=Pseudomonas aeruginosa TaxID=287 RepID=UPI000D74E3BD|nr:PAAR domain-containing protein [Pseudomonas aeruginosa]AWQ82303.1 PAAR motif family protein [Pseudomonas aeruginosa]MBG4275862.1 PAAR domain-containing protein [Pseudomonas aeruginosa]MBN7869929.1 PAAR domain-containing protein [Pseudomonas aeruginosa]QYE78218.1 PAAR domain-containing protein [Pseudomonas aeruginosa]HBO3292220.1 PAAR domain-containing protein [Pseudomonas aeruginosa]
MSKPAARLGDTNACPLPGHGSNPTVSGSPDVLINGLPALRVGDSSACGDAVAEGIGCILVNGQPIAFLGSATAHGGVIVSGSGDVLVGTQHTPAPFVAPTPMPGGFNCQLRLSAANGQPYSHLSYRAVLEDGSVRQGVTDSAGATQPIRTTTQMTIISIQLLPPAIAACCSRPDPAQGGGLTMPLSGVRTAPAKGQNVNTVPLSKDDKSRALTSGELAMAQSLFKDSIDYSRVKVHNEEYLPFGLQPDNTAMTPNGELYFNPDYYKDDFSISATDQHWFMHEMAHVWQYQLGYWVKLHGLLLHPGSLWGLLGDPYRYELKPGDKLQDFNMEQQGDILADYYCWTIGNPTRSISGQAVANIGLHQSVLSDFLRNPNDKNLLP